MEVCKAKLRVNNQIPRMGCPFVVLVYKDKITYTNEVWGPEKYFNYTRKKSKEKPLTYFITSPFQHRIMGRYRTTKEEMEQLPLTPSLSEMLWVGKGIHKIYSWGYSVGGAKRYFVVFFKTSILVISGDGDLIRKKMRAIKVDGEAPILFMETSQIFYEALIGKDIRYRGMLKSFTGTI